MGSSPEVRVSSAHRSPNSMTIKKRGSAIQQKPTNVPVRLIQSDPTRHRPRNPRISQDTKTVEPTEVGQYHDAIRSGEVSPPMVLKVKGRFTASRRSIPAAVPQATAPG